ncbi:SIMPL domain-containing protein [Mangrovibacterium marinum]|uniref:Secreted protein n=1 Tax=Mangrovibacterium marinum TaxID=1639118 RepID=A0A2T5C4J5_9BACT|nr:SIMPL domain-containing protein [Mangrovibacterium marinum]PTN09779.1 hypothetical protein C8N47_10373 [Mangrovibacterium marinum]
MKTFHLFLVLMVAATVARAQTAINPLESTPYIEVTGEGELEIVPDEIYLQFTLKERMDGRSKTELDQIEKELKKKLSSAGFNLTDLTLADANADFVTIKRKKKDVLASKDYQMKLSQTGQIATLLDVLDEVKAENAYISRLDHSQMEQFKKDVKIKAAKNAHDKAQYLLGALGQKAGNILFIQERESYLQPYVRKAAALGMVADMQAESASEPEISFRKIKLNYKVFARFAIAE